MTDEEIKKRIENMSFELNNFVDNGRGILLTEKEINVLKRHDIKYDTYNNIKSLLFDIEDILNTVYDEELDQVSNSIAERSYYYYTNK